jgi:hypothetical protein
MHVIAAVRTQGDAPLAPSTAEQPESGVALGRAARFRDVEVEEQRIAGFARS